MGPSGILLEIIDKSVAFDLHNKHTPKNTYVRTLMQFKNYWNIFPYFTIEFHPVFIRSKIKKWAPANFAEWKSN